METADPALVRRALHEVLVWPPDLEPDGRYEAVADLDVAAYSAALCRRLDRSGRVPLRVGQSALVMGVASRLWAVTVVPATTHRVLPDPGRLLVRQDDGAVTLGVGTPAGGLDPDADDVRRAVLGVLEPLVAQVHLSRRLLWGNVAASLYAVPRVHALPGAAPLVEALVGAPPLAGELELHPTRPARRRTCCLFYLAPGAGLCGDCVLGHLPGRSA